MSSAKNTKVKEPVGWARAARDARRQIEAAKARIVSLQRSLKICEKKLKEGEPWPGGQADEGGFCAGR
jgi:hypothetical protein